MPPNRREIASIVDSFSEQELSSFFEEAKYAPLMSFVMSPTSAPPATEESQPRDLASAAHSNTTTQDETTKVRPRANERVQDESARSHQSQEAHHAATNDACATTDVGLDQHQNELAGKESTSHKTCQDQIFCCENGARSEKKAGVVGKFSPVSDDELILHNVRSSHLHEQPNSDTLCSEKEACVVGITLLNQSRQICPAKTSEPILDDSANIDTIGIMLAEDDARLAMGTYNQSTEGVDEMAEYFQIQHLV